MNNQSNRIVSSINRSLQSLGLQQHEWKFDAIDRMFQWYRLARFIDGWYSDA